MKTLNVHISTSNYLIDFPFTGGIYSGTRYLYTEYLRNLKFSALYGPVMIKLWLKYPKIFSFSRSIEVRILIFGYVVASTCNIMVSVPFIYIGNFPPYVNYILYTTVEVPSDR